MELILNERGRTHSAYMNNEEWTNYGTVESTLDGLLDFLVQAKKRESQQMTIQDGNPIEINFVGGAGIILSQILIDYNQSDREILLAELGRILAD